MHTVQGNPKARRDENFHKKVGVIGAVIAAAAMGLAACQTSGTMTSLVTDKGEQFASWLAKPEGDGPFPAIVLTHGCDGIQRNTSHQATWRGLNRHAALLNDYGYVTLIVDSFGQRRITDGCRTGGKYYPVQVSDALAAFDHLASLPFVDAERIGFVGLSLGGGTAMRLALRSTVNSRTREGRGTYAALVAYYPWCEATWAHALKRPVLILIGAKDDWTPDWRCETLRNLAETSRTKPTLELTVYPDAHHAFDLPMGGPFRVEGEPGVFHTTQGNDKARRDSQARMLTFFAKHLGGPYPAAAREGVDAAGHSGFGNILRAAFALND